MAASIILIGIGSNKEWQEQFRTIVPTMATQYLAWFSDLPMVGRDVSTNADQFTSGVFQTWPWRNIQWGSLSRTCKIWECLPVTPLVLQLHFRDHSKTLDDPHIDTWSEITNNHFDFYIGSSCQIYSPISHSFITRPLYQLIHDNCQAKRE